MHGQKDQPICRGTPRRHARTPVGRGGQLSLGPVAIRRGHGHPLLLSGGGAQVGSEGGIVRVQGALDELGSWGVAPGLVIQADLFEVGDIGDDAVVVGLVGGVVGGGLGRFGARHVGRGARDGGRLAIGTALGGDHIVEGQRRRGRGQRERSL